jgi:hypothetical protein
MSKGYFCSRMACQAIDFNPYRYGWAATLSGGMLVWPPGVSAQVRPRWYRIGILSPTRPQIFFSFIHISMI